MGMYFEKANSPHESVRKESINHLTDVFNAALKRVDPYKIIIDHVSLKGNVLVFEYGDSFFKVNLEKYKQIMVLGAGKAGFPMAKALEDVLQNRIGIGFIAVKEGYAGKLTYVDIMECGHPIPNNASINAAKRVEAIAQSADENTLIINLLSGGGSSILANPIDYFSNNGSEIIQLTLEDIQITTRRLLECGATINEINCIRKHLSKIKGGRLAEIMYPADSINLILSDVVGDRLDTIASGLTAPDNTTYKQAIELLNTYDIADEIPEKVLRILQLGMEGVIPETPKADSVVFSNLKNVLIGTNRQSLFAAQKKAKALGYNTLILSSQITGEAKEVAKVFLGIAKEIKQTGVPLSPPALIIAGGETTVTIQGNGKGGRNQEMALSFLLEIAELSELEEGMYFLSGATDGTDGPTDAAGAFADKETAVYAEKSGLSIRQYLQNNDAYGFFSKLGGLLKTGATHTNVCDIQLLIIR